MQPAASDLDNALTFVIAQVEGESARSGMPLDDEERYLLAHLPAAPATPYWFDAETAIPTPRDLPYEKLCKLAKGARIHDLRTRPGAEREWKFTASVLKLNRHPMSWLLKWAGVRERRPWWDGWLLIGTALVVITCAMVVMLFAEAKSATWTWINWFVFSCGCPVVVIGIYFASRRFEKWQARQAVERSRRGLS
jgi:hypothetical protein